MKLIERPNEEAAIFARLAWPDEAALSSAASEGILALEFSQPDQDRMEVFAAQARDGKLTDEEMAEVEAYSRVISLLGILKSKARRALKSRGVNGKARPH